LNHCADAGTEALERHGAEVETAYLQAVAKAQAVRLALDLPLGGAQFGVGK